MAEIGNHTPSPDMEYDDALSVTRGIRVTMPEAANGAASIFFYAETVTGAAVHAAIYEDGADPGLIVSEIATYTTVSAPDWHEIPLDTTVLSDATAYIICVRDSGASSQLSVRNGDSNTDGWRDFYGNLFSGGAWQDPATDAWDPGSYTEDLAIYLEYTPDAGGVVNMDSWDTIKENPVLSKKQVVNY